MSIYLLYRQLKGNVVRTSIVGYTSMGLASNGALDFHIPSRKRLFFGVCARFPRVTPWPNTRNACLHHKNWFQWGYSFFMWTIHFHVLLLYACVHDVLGLLPPLARRTSSRRHTACLHRSRNAPFALVLDNVQVLNAFAKCSPIPTPSVGPQLRTQALILRRSVPPPRCLSSVKHTSV